MVILTGHGECGHDPAVVVEHVSWDAGAHAVDGVADEVVGGDQEAADEQDGGRRAVVQLEERGVDVGLVAAVANLITKKAF